MRAPLVDGDAAHSPVEGTSRKAPLTVVKLGGSLQHSPLLRPWLAALAQQGGTVALVPGGGAFADAVRAAQAHWQFDDLHAHNMAVLGMAQMAQLMQALEPRVRLAGCVPTVREACCAGEVPVWQPLDLLRTQPDALTGWDVTSDSLAAWLAMQLGATHLWLVKACPVPAQADLPALAAQGIVDAALPGLLRTWDGHWRVVEAAHLPPPGPLR